MDVYIGIGLSIATIIFCVWISLFGILLLEFASAYIHNRPPVKPTFIKRVFPKSVSLYSYNKRRYQAAGLDPADAIDGDFAAVVGFAGFFATLGTIPFWPVTITWGVIKGLREYYNNPEFRAFFSSNVTAEEKPLKGLK